MNLKNSILLTHRNCSDGFGCALLFIAAGGSRDKVFYSNPDHSSVDDALCRATNLYPNDGIIIADLSICESTADRVVSEGLNLIVLDHHKSAEGLAGRYFCEIDNSRCGCRILYDYLRSHVDADLTPYYELVTMIDDRDRWVNQYPQALDISSLYYVLKNNRMLDRFLKNPTIKLDEKEQFVIDIERDKSKEYIADKIKEAKVVDRIIDGKNYRIALVEAGTNQSELGHALCEELDADIAMMVSGRAVSLRSNNPDTDVSKISRLNLGGGHRSSSGFAIRNILKDDLVNVIYNGTKFE